MLDDNKIIKEFNNIKNNLFAIKERIDINSSLTISRAVSVGVSLLFLLTSFNVFQSYSIERTVQSSIVDSSTSMAKNFEELVKSGDFKSAFFSFKKSSDDTTKQLKNTSDAIEAAQKVFSDKITKLEKDNDAANSEFRARSGQMVTSLDNLKTSFDQFGTTTQKSLSENLESIRVDSSKRLDGIKKELGGQLGSQIGTLDSSLSKRLESLEKRVKSSEDGLFNIEKIFKVPDSNKLEPVQFVLDDGSGMANYRFQDAVDTVLYVMGDSMKRSPKRKIGLTIGHDGQLAVKVKTEILYDVSYQNLRSDSANFRVNRNSATNHLDLLESAVSQLSAIKTEGQKILVLVTGGMNTKIPNSIDIVKSCDQAKIAVFVMQLSAGAGDSPSPALSAVSNESGGNFTTIYFSANLEGPKLDTNRNLLRRALFSCLGISESVER